MKSETKPSKATTCTSGLPAPTIKIRGARNDERRKIATATKLMTHGWRFWTRQVEMTGDVGEVFAEDEDGPCRTHLGSLCFRRDAAGKLADVTFRPDRRHIFGAPSRIGPLNVETWQRPRGSWRARWRASKAAAQG